MCFFYYGNLRNFACYWPDATLCRFSLDGLDIPRFVSKPKKLRVIFTKKKTSETKMDSEISGLSPRSVEAKVLDCSLKVTGFELQSCYYVHFPTYTHGKDMNLFNPLQLWLFGFYGKSTFVGYLMPNPFLSNYLFYFKQFSLAWVQSLIVKNISILSYSVKSNSSNSTNSF